MIDNTLAVSNARGNNANPNVRNYGPHQLKITPEGIKVAHAPKPHA